MCILYIDIDSLRPDHLGCYGGIVNLTGKVAGLDQMETKCKVKHPRSWALST